MGKRDTEHQASQQAGDAVAEAQDATVAAAEPGADERLEDEIASVFRALQAEATEGEAPDGDSDAQPADDAELATFLLLGELDRLWQQAA